MFIRLQFSLFWESKREYKRSWSRYCFVCVIDCLSLYLCVHNSFVHFILLFTNIRAHNFFIPFHSFALSLSLSHSNQHTLKQTDYKRVYSFAYLKPSTCRSKRDLSPSISISLCSLFFYCCQRLYLAAQYMQLHTRVVPNIS